MNSRRRIGSFSRVLIPLVIAAFVLALLGCGREPKQPDRQRSKPASPAEQALVVLADRYADMKAFSERTRITETISDGETQDTAVSETEFLFRRPNRIFYQMKGDDTTVIACNGERLIVYSSAQGGYVEQDPPQDFAAFVRDHHTEGVGLDELLLLAGNDPLAALEDVSLEQGEPLGGQPMQVLKATVQQLAERASGAPATSTQSLWVGKNDGLLHKTVTEIKRGEATLRVEEVITESAADPSLSDDRFEYQPPAGAENLTPG